MEEVLERAKSAVGGATALSAKLAEIGVFITPQAISQWRRVPVARATVVARVTGISRRELRPDIWNKAR